MQSNIHSLMPLGPTLELEGALEVTLRPGQRGRARRACAQASHHKATNRTAAVAGGGGTAPGPAPATGTKRLAPRQTHSRQAHNVGLVGWLDSTVRVSQDCNQRVTSSQASLIQQHPFFLDGALAHTFTPSRPRPSRLAPPSSPPRPCPDTPPRFSASPRRHWKKTTETSSDASSDEEDRQGWPLIAPPATHRRNLHWAHRPSKSGPTLQPHLAGQRDATFAITRAPARTGTSLFSPAHRRLCGRPWHCIQTGAPLDHQPPQLLLLLLPLQCRDSGLLLPLLLASRTSSTSST